MNRVISLSALVYGLLASQGLAPAATVLRRADETNGALTAPEQPLSTDAKAQFHAELLQLIEKGPHDIGGMRAFQRAVATEMQQHMNNLLAADIQLENDPPTPDLIAERPIQRTEKGTFLGITTSRVTPTLREQLNLQKGF
jgi:hypothetical protein